MVPRAALRTIVGGLLSGLAWTIGRLPIRLQADIKQRLSPVGVLDYPNARIRLHADTRWQVSRLRSCAKEPETVRWIETAIRPDDVFYDIGANVGAYSFVTAATGGDHVTVIAFEPGFLNFAQLSMNVILNGMSRQIIPLCVALSSQTALARFELSELVGGAASHTLRNRDSTPSDALSSQVVWTQGMAYRLDDLINEMGLPPPNLMKIDVDGGELQVLHGADKALGHPGLRSVLVEIELGTDIDRNPVVDFLVKNKRFRLAAKYPRQLEHVFNCIFIR